MSASNDSSDFSLIVYYNAILLQCRAFLLESFVEERREYPELAMVNVKKARVLLRLILNKEERYIDRNSVAKVAYDIKNSLTRNQLKIKSLAGSKKVTSVLISSATSPAKLQIDSDIKLSKASPINFHQHPYFDINLSSKSRQSSNLKQRSKVEAEMDANSCLTLLKTPQRNSLINFDSRRINSQNRNSFMINASVRASQRP